MGAVSPPYGLYIEKDKIEDELLQHYEELEKIDNR